MDVKKIIFLYCVLLQMHDLDLKQPFEPRFEIFEFGIFENFNKNKEIRLLEASLVNKMYDKKGKAYK